jgi:hypothetical protein
MKLDLKAGDREEDPSALDRKRLALMKPDLNALDREGDPSA